MFFIIIYIPTMYDEEKVLLSQHNEDYKKYFNQIPRFFPKLGTYAKPNKNEMIEIKIRNIQRVLFEVVGFIFFFGLIQLLNFLHHKGHLIFILELK